MKLCFGRLVSNVENWADKLGLGLLRAKTRPVVRSEYIGI